MLKTLKLILPALMPSWDFFDTIEASPRIDFLLKEKMNSKNKDWQEFDPRNPSLNLKQFSKKLFYNPKWNEYLWLSACAERFLKDETDIAFLNHIKETMIEHTKDKAPYMQFRIIYLYRDETYIHYTSETYNLSKDQKK